MQLKHVLAALPVLALASTTQADFNTNNQVHVAAINYFHQNECGGVWLTLQSLDASSKINTTGATRSSNEYGYSSQSLKAEGFMAELRGAELVDGACVEVWDTAVLQGLDGTTTLLDGTTAETLMCLDETGLDDTRSCHVQGVTTSHNRATIAARVVLPMTGHVVETNVRLEATDTKIVLKVKINPALFNLSVNSNIPGEEEQLSQKTHMEQVDQARFMLAENIVLADVLGSIKLDGQEFVPSDTVNAGSYGSTAVITTLKQINVSGAAPMPLYY